MPKFLTDPMDTVLGILLITMAVLLLGCASNPAPDTGPMQITPKATCIPIRTWSAAEQDALAAALTPLPSTSVIWSLEKDWQAMRDAARACAHG